MRLKILYILLFCLSALFVACGSFIYENQDEIDKLTKGQEVYLSVVRAQAGERITLASSAQSGTNNNILLYGPTGTQITLTKSSGDGNIPNRAAELAGPSLYNVTPSGDRYKPIYYNVQTEGIYRVEFLSLGTSDPGSTVNADGNWGNTNSSSSGIAAWDISVTGKTKSVNKTDRVLLK